MYKFIGEVKVHPKMLTTDPAELISQLVTQQFSVSQKSQIKVHNLWTFQTQFVHLVQLCKRGNHSSSLYCLHNGVAHHPLLALHPVDMHRTSCKLTKVQGNALSRYVQACHSLNDKFLSHKSTQSITIWHNPDKRLPSYPGPTNGLGTRLVFCYNSLIVIGELIIVLQVKIYHVMI